MEDSLKYKIETTWPLPSLPPNTALLAARQILFEQMNKGKGSFLMVWNERSKKNQDRQEGHWSK